MPEPAEYFRLTCLTPVHVGNGLEYANGVDLVSHGGNTHLLDSERVLDKLAATGQLPRDVDDLRTRIQRLFEHEPPEEYQLATYAGVLPGALNVRAAIRAGDGHPILPGSSIKGALRTLIFVGWLGASGPHDPTKGELAPQLADSLARAKPRSKFAAGGLEERLFGSSVQTHFGLAPKDAKADLMRMCVVADAPFRSDEMQVTITSAAGTNRNTTTAVEALPSASSAVIRLSLDAPYLKSMFTEELPHWSTLVEWSRRHARHLLEIDRQYFNRSVKELGRDCGQIVERLDALQREIESADGDRLFLRLGWGTGWRTMTGDYLKDEDRRRLLEKSDQLGPKTRKVIIADAAPNASAVNVLGWISLSPVSQAEALRAQSELSPPRLRALVTADARPAESNGMGQGDSFLQAVATIQVKDWGRLSDFYRRAMAESSLKDSRLAALAERVAQVWKGDKRRLREAADKFPELANHVKLK